MSIDTETGDQKKEKSKLKSAIQFAVPLILSIAIFAYIYKDEDWGALTDTIKRANAFWFMLPIAIGCGAHIIRALRWRMLIKASGMDAGVGNTFMSVMVGYLANFIFPRAGEVARCGMMKKYSECSFTTTLGTVVTERLTDLVITAGIMMLTIALQYDVFRETLEGVNIGEKILGILTNPFVILLAIVLAFGIAFVVRKRSKSRLYAKGRESLAKVGKGFAAIRNVENKPLFVLYSLAIFVCYYLMLHVSLWAFDFTSGITVSQGLVIYVMGSLGIIAPVQGGIGAWHFMTIQALMLYGVSAPDAKAFALVVHTVQTVVVYVGIGLLCYVLLPIANRKK